MRRTETSFSTSDRCPQIRWNYLWNKRHSKLRFMIELTHMKDTNDKNVNNSCSLPRMLVD